MTRDELRSIIMKDLLDAIERTGRQIYELTDAEIDTLSEAVAQNIAEAMKSARKALET